MIYDVVIIGLGPAGIKLAKLLKENDINYLVFEFSMPGGKVNIAPQVDNYPYHEPVDGPTLAFELFESFLSSGCNYVSEQVLSVAKEEDTFIIKSNNATYYAKTVVAASGTLEKKLNLDNEDKLFGHGLSYCAICDGHFVKDKIAMVVAEDKYAISEALYLASICKKVIVVTSNDKLKGEKRRLDALYKYQNVEVILNSKVVALLGEDKLTGVRLDNEQEIMVDGLFPLVGYIPNTSYLPKEILNTTGFVVVDKKYETNIANLFAIGDVIERELKQIYLAELDANKVFDVIKERNK